MAGACGSSARRRTRDGEPDGSPGVETGDDNLFERLERPWIVVVGRIILVGERDGLRVAEVGREGGLSGVDARGAAAGPPIHADGHADVVDELSDRLALRLRRSRHPRFGRHVGPVVGSALHGHVGRDVVDRAGVGRRGDGRRRHAEIPHRLGERRRDAAAHVVVGGVVVVAVVGRSGRVDRALVPPGRDERIDAQVGRRRKRAAFLQIRAFVPEQSGPFPLHGGRFAGPPRGGAARCRAAFRGRSAVDARGGLARGDVAAKERPERVVFVGIEAVARFGEREDGVDEVVGREDDEAAAVELRDEEPRARFGVFDLVDGRDGASGGEFAQRVAAVDPGRRGARGVVRGNLRGEERGGEEETREEKPFHAARSYAFFREKGSGTRLRGGGCVW